MNSEVVWKQRIDNASKPAETVELRVRILYQDSRSAHRYELVEDGNPRHGWLEHKWLLDGSELHANSRKFAAGKIVIPAWLARKKGWV